MSELRTMRYELYETGGATLIESCTTTMDQHLNWVPEPSVKPDGYPVGYEWRVFTDTGKHVYTNSYTIESRQAGDDA